MDKVAIIGASRGLGAQLVRQVPLEIPILGIARKNELLRKIEVERKGFSAVAFDLTKDFDAILTSILQFEPTRLFYMAGGGPYGAFADKSWKDHLWAWEVTFLAAARLVHALLNKASAEKVPQIVLCGSAVAEDAGDPQAASYASAKHAMKGLHQSLKLENPKLDIRLFSPGYLDTELLPKNASVRYKNVWNPELVAKELWDWACSNDHAGHKSFLPHP